VYVDPRRVHVRRVPQPSQHLAEAIARPFFKRGLVGIIVTSRDAARAEIVAAEVEKIACKPVAVVSDRADPKTCNASLPSGRDGTRSRLFARAESRLMTGAIVDFDQTVQGCFEVQPRQPTEVQRRSLAVCARQSSRSRFVGRARGM
jgi:hypothetical protein